MKKNVIISLCLCFIILSCEKKTSNVDPTTFDNQVRAMGSMNQKAQSDEPTITKAPEKESTSDDVCTVTKYTASPGYNELFLLDPSADVIYPGALLKGGSIPSGEYTPLVADRKPITISISLQNISGSPTRTIKDPKPSTVTETIKELLSSEVTGPTAAKVTYSMENIYSAEQLNLALRANFKNQNVDVKAMFDFSRTEIHSRMLIKFLQVFYTISIDPPGKPSDFFNVLPDINTLGNCSPVYVSTMTYGRMVLYSISSTQSLTELNAALNLNIQAATASGGTDDSASYTKLLKSSEMKFYIVGGAADSALKVLDGGLKSLNNFIISGANYSKDSPSAPLSYKLSYLKDGSVANIVLSSDYSIRDCKKVTGNYEIILDTIQLNRGCMNQNLWGNFSAYLPGTSAPAYIWNLSKESHSTTDNRILWDFTKSNPAVSQSFTVDNAAVDTSLILTMELWDYDSPNVSTFLGRDSVVIQNTQFDGGERQLVGLGDCTSTLKYHIKRK